MIRLPEGITRPLLDLLTDGRAAVLLRADSQGRLEHAEGDLSRFGLHQLRTGMSLCETVDFLTGLLPLAPASDLCLPLVEVTEGIVADVYLLAEPQADWVVLLDATETAGRQQRLQQRANEANLLLDRRSALHDSVGHLLELLDMWPLYRTAAGLTGFGDIPSWWKQVHGPDDAASDLTDYLKRSPFLDSFLAEAQILWEQEQAAELESGEWIETAGGGTLHHFEATALNTGMDGLLLIRLLGVDGHERQRLLQTARESELSHRSLEKQQATHAAQLEQDISARREELKAALEDQQSLLRELHHRVGNSVQVIASLMSLQAGQAEEATLRDQLTEGGRRVQAMALAHEVGFSEGAFNHVDLSVYLSKLVDGMLAALPTTVPTAAKVDVQTVAIDIESVVPLGLLVNELLCGALARTPQEPTRFIEVRLETEEAGQLTVIIIDTGKCLQPASDSFEASLIQLLSEQLRAEVQESEAVWRLRFHPDSLSRDPTLEN